MFALVALLLLASAVHASVYVINPVQASQCAGGQACQVQWTDNGESPLLSDIGECQVAIYTGENQLVQSLPSVNVATSSSFTFTPDPAAGPNGQLYYIVFTSSGINYQGFSGTFTLTGMTGTTPGGGSSIPATTSTTDTSSGSSTPAGSSAPATTLTGTTTTSTPATTPVTTPGTTTFTTPTTTSTRVTTSTSSSASATPSNAAGRVGSSTSLGGIAALLVLSGAVVF